MQEGARPVPGSRGRSRSPTPPSGEPRLARQAGDAAGDEYWSGLVAEVDDMIWQAVWVEFGYFQREAGYTR